jgi:hypothetical protein
MGQRIPPEAPSSGGGSIDVEVDAVPYLGVETLGLIAGTGVTLTVSGAVPDINVTIDTIGVDDHANLSNLAWDTCGHTYDVQEIDAPYWTASWVGGGQTTVALPVVLNATDVSNVGGNLGMIVGIADDSEWVSSELLNQDDTHTIVARPDGAVTWNNMPAAETAMFGQTWSFVANTENKTQVKISGFRGAAAIAAAKLGAQFSIDGGATWRWFDDGTATAGTGIGLHVPYYNLTTGTNVVGDSGWTTMHSTAISDVVWVRVVGSDGDGAIDPSWRIYQVSFR